MRQDAPCTSAVGGAQQQRSAELAALYGAVHGEAPETKTHHVMMHGWPITTLPVATKCAPITVAARKGTPIARVNNNVLEHGDPEMPATVR